MGSVKSVKKWSRRFVWAAVIFFILLNILAYRHARSFFFYADGGMRTPPPEALTLGQKISVLTRGIIVPKPRAHATPENFGMWYDDVFIPGRDDLSLSAWRIPGTNSKSVAVLFHGYSSEKSGLLPEAKIFHEMGYDVWLVDFPGSGESPGNMTTLGLQEARDVASALRWIRNERPAGRITVYGHSMGGAAIMRAMALHDARPDVAIVESVFDTLLQAIRFRFNLMSVPSFPSAEILLGWGSYQLGENGFKHDVVKYAERVDTPTMVIHGVKDNRASVTGAKRVFNALSGDKKLLLLDEAGHVNPCLSDQHAWRDAVFTFIHLQSGKSTDNEMP